MPTPLMIDENATPICPAKKAPDDRPDTEVFWILTLYPWRATVTPCCAGELVPSVSEGTESSGATHAPIRTLERATVIAIATLRKTSFEQKIFMICLL